MHGEDISTSDQTKTVWEYVRQNVIPLCYMLEFELILLHAHQVLAELMHFFEAYVGSLVFVNHKTDASTCTYISTSSFAAKCQISDLSQVTCPAGCMPATSCLPSGTQKLLPIDVTKL